MSEKPLHATLKEWYAHPGDQLEAPVGDFIADIVRGDLLIEIQTASFASIKRKLLELTVHHPVRLVYPIARQKWIVKLAEDGHTQLSRRRSPKRGVVEDVFAELVSFPSLLASPNFSLEVSCSWLWAPWSVSFGITVRRRGSSWGMPEATWWAT